ncbi:MAG: 1-phosphofructokinase, partial [Deferribacteraceae bacterium]|nr:1-phosphofructokinase [Deferribacteraceae bacterium]
LDYTLHLETLRSDNIQRSYEEAFYPGGKGINVSNVLTRLDVPNVALGFVAGFTGNEIERLVKELGIQSKFVHIAAGNSRVNVKIRPQDGTETDINASGCDIDTPSLNAFYKQIEKLHDDDYLVVSGSVPKALPSNIYETILRRISSRPINCAIDATGKLLRSTLKYKPFLIKPNKEELGELFGQFVSTSDDVVRLAETLQKEGARNVLVSMGSDGAILVTEDHKMFRAQRIRGTVVNTVGAGDAMTAGFIAGWLKHGDYQKAINLGAAAGAATAFCESIATKDEIYSIFNTL